MNPLRPLLVGLLAGTASLGAVSLAHAAFFDPATSSSTFSTATLAPPTGLGLTQTCVLGLGGVAVSARFTATWTPSTADWATGQEVVLVNAGGVQQGELQSLSRTATTAVFDVLVPVDAHTVTVRTRYASWTAQASATAVAC